MIKVDQEALENVKKAYEQAMIDVKNASDKDRRYYIGRMREIGEAYRALILARY